MIIERHMKQAKRIDTRETIQGYLIVHGNYSTIKKSSLVNNGKGGMLDSYVVDYATVEDVAVKPIENGWTYCPNCEEPIDPVGKPNYCESCGQRIDWSV